ncbi:MAG: NERD domain-containing protein, partial [Candidatus Competibacteraceae bacterium]|nr:NERD domain-containing protein [Candidatus Competibacteraceae bacterium]
MKPRTTKGNIFGQPKDKTWTQRVGRKSFKFGNPLRQNYLHTQAVKALVPGVPVYGQVAFTNVARFPKGVPEGVSALKTLKADLGPLLQADTVDPVDLNGAWQQLQATARTDRETRQAHIAGIQAKHGKDYR